MNAKELIRNARESLDVIAIPNIVDNEVRYYQLEERIKKLAEHILATVREDDDELITDEWLESQGIVDYGDADDCQSFYVKLEDGFTVDIFDGPERCVTLCDKKPTRGQLRKLLESLGVQ